MARCLEQVLKSRWHGKGSKELQGCRERSGGRLLNRRDGGCPGQPPFEAMLPNATAPARRGFSHVSFVMAPHGASDGPLRIFGTLFTQLHYLYESVLRLKQTDTMAYYIPSITLPGSIFANPAASILVPVLAGTAVGYSTRPKDTQKTYLALRQPPLRPPPYVFGPVWTLLYGAMGYAAHRAWTVGLNSFDPAKVQLAKVRLSTCICVHHHR